ncbi:polysaccharide biosynthesis C-terminal domain-containing protein, partial [Crocinitomicaceae bacterium]|nr:polysaccharide biosynthesis C-terminal domain-containing protein [Crocinitomicaceae bacterium]
DFFGGINGHIFLSSKKYKYDVIFTLVLLVNVATLNYFLIPLYGIAGAAISTSVALVVYNLARMIYVYFAFGLHPLERSQLILLALFLLNVMLFETVFDFQFHALIGAGLKGILFCVTFILPVYIFNIEPNSVDYIKKILAKIGVKRTL